MLCYLKEYALKTWAATEQETLIIESRLEKSLWKFEKKKSFIAVSYFRCMCSGPYWTHERAPELGGYNSQILFSFFLFCLVFPHRFPDHCCYCSTSPLVHQRQLVNALKCSHHFSHPLKENFEMCLPLLKEKKTFLWKKKHISEKRMLKKLNDLSIVLWVLKQCTQYQAIFQGA